MASSQITDVDFEQVAAFLKEQPVYPDPPSVSCLGLSRSVHRLTHTLIIWRFRLQRLPEHSRVFVEEIASDALQILPQFLLGYDKPFRLLVRGAIENCIRYVYFSDHPIEFHKMNVHPKWYVQVEELFTYASEHPVLSSFEKKYDAVHRLKDLYSELSAGVHGRRVQDFQMKVALSKLRFEDESATKQEQLLVKAVQNINAVMAAFNLEAFHKFEIAEKRLILQSIPKAGRAALSQL